jgi:hypothetical protein
MPVEASNTEYQKHKDQWERCEDAFEGTDAVKAKGAKYLPKLSGHKDAEDRYKAYKQRALWYNALRRTVEGVHGAVMRKDVTYVLPQPVEDQSKDITLDGMTLDELTKATLRRILMTGRYGLFTSYSEDEKRPFIRGYDEKNILYWESDRWEGRTQLTHLRLKEVYLETDAEDEFSVTEKDQIRVFRLMSNDTTGTGLVVDVYRLESSASGGDEWVSVEQIFPTRQGERLQFIPFSFVSGVGTQPGVEEAPFLDLADVNYTHYRTDADYRANMFLCANPQLLLTGWETPITDSTETDGYEGEALNSKVPIGSEYALIQSAADADAKWIELEGKSLETQSTEEDRLEKKMAVLGARILEEQKAGIETAAAQQFRHAGERSALAGLVRGVESGIEQALSQYSWWAGSLDSWQNPMDNEILDVDMNKDYMAASMPPQMLTALMQGLQNGNIDFETWHYNLKKGEITIPDDTPKAMEERLFTQNPMFVPATFFGDGEDVDIEEAA